MTKKQFVVIGRGRFGSSVASLSQMGYEVLAIDIENNNLKFLMRCNECI